MKPVLKGDQVRPRSEQGILRATQGGDAVVEIGLDAAEANAGIGESAAGGFDAPGLGTNLRV
ncbi:MAG: hypothetical protein NVS3B18_11350 [Candidatus Dormibacteria bacterium]